VLDSWRSSGSVVAPVSATPYPTDRYQTKLLWWNRRDFFAHAQPRQLAKIVCETKDLLHEQFRRGEIGTDLTALITPAFVAPLRPRLIPSNPEFAEV
jgi:hypothetical protein